MRMIRILSLAVVAAVLTVGAPPTQASAMIISDLYSTGVDASHATLGDGVIDPHYALTSSPVGPGSAFVVDPNGFPFPHWLANDPVGTAGGSMWISGPATPATTEPNGPYNYRTMFTIGAGFDPATASITGFLTADDRVSVLLNGVSVVPLTPSEGYGSFYAFSILSGFTAGTNTLDFLVQNTHGSVEGLRVEMTGQVAAVPEPSSLVMAAMGVVGSAGFALSRRRKV